MAVRATAQESRVARARANQSAGFSAVIQDGGSNATLFSSEEEESEVQKSRFTRHVQT